MDPGSLDSYRATGGYEMLRRAVRLGPQGVIRELKDAKLLGRGGAAFPTAVKWEAVATNPVRPHYVVCNADESEPGTFKDRVLMEEDPFALVEAITIMGYACGAEQGYLYIRGEYPLAEARLRHAVEQARSRGFLGADVMGEGFAFDIEVRRGAGAYIAGEETALFNSIEGKRAEPRNKPPFPAQSGLFGKPTAINNVETLLCVPEILSIGGPAFAGIGTENSTGTRLFCLSGCVEQPGLYEFEFGVTLRQVIEAAGGVRGGRPLRAVLLGGAAGSFVGPDALDTPLTFEGVRAIGATLGSGVVLVLDDTVDVTGLLRRIARFFRDESCGQCVPCRVGTVRQEELLGRLARGTPLGSTRQELVLLEDIAAVARDASICGLGQTAVSAAASAVRLGLIGGEREGVQMSAVFLEAPRRLVDVTIDGETVRVPEGATLLEACRQQGIDTPTLCYLENLTPVNVCRVCVVEVEGSRALVPACSRKAEPGMTVHTDSERVRTSRRMVLEFLASSADMALAAPEVRRWMERLRRRPGPVRPGGPRAPGRGAGRRPAR